MKKFVINVLIVIVSVFAIDNLLGGYLNKHFSIRAFEPSYMAYNNKYDLVMFGASEMNNQYISNIISDSLHISAYNFGSGGQNIYYQYTLLNLMINNAPTKPRFVLFDPSYIDFYDTPGWNEEKMDVFYPMYEMDDTLTAMVNLQGWRSTIMLSLLKCYRHNSMIIAYVLKAIHPNKIININLGYSALEPKVFDKSLTRNEEDNNYTFDKQKLKYLKRFIHQCKLNNIKLIFINAPYYEISSEIKWINYLEEICDEENIVFLNYNNDSFFLSHRELYNDVMHFNKYGAEEYTKRIIPDLKNIINNN